MLLRTRSAVTLRSLLCFAPLIAGGLALFGCGDTQDRVPKVSGTLTITPDILPFEGGTVQLDWQTHPAGATVRGHTTSGAEMTLDATPSGLIDSFELMHPLQKTPIHSASVIVRPAWKMPPAISLARTSQLRGALVQRSGVLTVVGETEEAQAGASLGGSDIFIYRFAAKGALHSQHQIGTVDNDRSLGLRESGQGVHLLMQTGNRYAHLLVDEAGRQAIKPVMCLQLMTTVWDWQILPDQSLLALATTSDNLGSKLHLVHCSNISKGFELIAQTTRPLTGTTPQALLVQGTTPALGGQALLALLAITTSADLGAGSSSFAQPQLVRIDVANDQWQTKRLASPAGHQWLAGVMQASSDSAVPGSVQLIGQTQSTSNVNSTASGQSDIWLMQASPEGSFSNKTPLLDGEVAAPCCSAFKPARGSRPSAWVVGARTATGAATLTAMQLPDLEPIGTITLADKTYAALELSALALDASGDFYAITTALKQDQTRWLRVEQFNEMGQSRVPNAADSDAD